MRCLIISLLCTNFAMAAGAAAPRVTQLPPTAGAWAISSRSGAVAVVETGLNQVTLYPRLGSTGLLEGARRQPVGREPVSVAYKQVKEAGYFVVACRGDRSIHVLDEATLKPVKVFTPEPVVTGMLRVSAPSAASVPYVYYAVTTNRPGVGQGAVGRLDLAGLKNEGLLEMDQEDPYEIWASADGGTLYARRPNVSPMGVIALRMMAPAGPGRAARAMKVAYEHDTRPPFVPDPFGQSVASGTKLYTPDLKTPIAELPAQPLCFATTRPVFFGLNGESLVAMSYNTYQQVGEEVALPWKLPPPPSDPVAKAMAPLIGPPVDALADDKDQALLVREHGGRRAAVISWKQFNVPDEPFLYADVEGPTELAVGMNWSARVSPRDSSVKVELASGPEKMKLEGQRLTWIATSEDVGTVNASLRLTAGGNASAERLQNVLLTVRRASTLLPFVACNLFVTEDGKTAVASGPTERSRDPLKRAIGRGDVPMTRIVLIDLSNPSSPKITADRTLDVQTDLSFNGDLRSIEADEKFVYLPLLGSDVFLVLSRKDLSDVQRVFTPARVRAMRSAGGKLYVAFNDKPSIVYSLPELKPAEEPRFDPEAQRIPVPMQVAENWYYQGILFDPSMTKSLLLLRPSLFVFIPPPRDSRGASAWDNGDAAPITPWGVRLFGGNLQRISGQNIGSVGSPRAILMNDTPAAIGLMFQQGDSGKGRAELVAHDLITGTAIKPLVLMEEPLSAMMNGGGNEAWLHLAQPPRGGMLLALVGDRLFCLGSEEVKSIKPPEPLWIEPRQSAFVVTANSPPLTYRAHGGKAPLTFDLLGQNQGVVIDPKSGDVTIDVEKALEPHAEMIMRQIAEQWRLDAATRQNRSPEEAVEAYRQAASDRLKALTGQSATGIPVALPLTIVVRDAEQQSTQLSHVVIVDADPAAIARLAAALNAQQGDGRRRR